MMTFAISLLFTGAAILAVFTIVASLLQYAPRVLQLVDQYVDMDMQGNAVLPGRKVRAHFYARPVPVAGPAPVPARHRIVSARIFELSPVSVPVQASASPTLSELPEAA
ncbi:hypothetical protein [Sphingorhabdus sp. Alg239-R122]|uniref:hypothetical protein n=1 Tax=Sphingorhabdus sp. Alg239-R122 TaxID=2305989 RepID=UPI0013D9F50E|nr:hypothetical protein [Sphingorhabdus sp. Alg239-R122]